MARMPKIMKLFEKIINCFRKRPMPEDSRIELTDHGFNLTDVSNNRLELRWAEVKEIVVHKWDLYSYDEICLAFRSTDDNDSWLEIGEHSIGFDDALRAVEDHFSPLPEDWWAAVAQPPFEANRSVIWRSESC